jgi:hypothetical protein
MPIEANVRRQQQEALASVSQTLFVSAFAVPRAMATPSKLVVSQIEPLSD